MTLVIFHKIMIFHYSVLYIYLLLLIPCVAIFYSVLIGIYAVECTVYILYLLRDMLMCEIWDCYTDYCIGDCDAVYCGRNLPTFQKKALPTYSEQNYSEDGRIRFLPKVRITGLYWCVMKGVQVSYVYWTVYHFDSWRIRDQLDVTSY